MSNKPKAPPTDTHGKNFFTTFFGQSAPFNHEEHLRQRQQKVQRKREELVTLIADSKNYSVGIDLKKFKYCKALFPLVIQALSDPQHQIKSLTLHMYYLRSRIAMQQLALALKQEKLTLQQLNITLEYGNLYLDKGMLVKGKEEAEILAEAVLHRKANEFPLVELTVLGGAAIYYHSHLVKCGHAVDPKIACELPYEPWPRSAYQ